MTQDKQQDKNGVPVPRARLYFARTLKDELADLGALVDKAIRDIERIGAAEIERLGKANDAVRRL